MSTMVGISVLSIETKSWELSGKTWSAPPIASEAAVALRNHLFSAVFAVNPLVTPTLMKSTLDEAGFRRCLLITEQSFGHSITEIPEGTGCDLEHARWELAHPYAFGESDPTSALSWPARAGAPLVNALAPEFFAKQARLLDAAESLDRLGAR